MRIPGVHDVFHPFFRDRLDGIKDAGGKESGGHSGGELNTAWIRSKIARANSYYLDVTAPIKEKIRRLESQKEFQLNRRPNAYDQRSVDLELMRIDMEIKLANKQIADIERHILAVLNSHLEAYGEGLAEGLKDPAVKIRCPAGLGELSAD